MKSVILALLFLVGCWLFLVFLSEVKPSATYRVQISNLCSCPLDQLIHLNVSMSPYILQSLETTVVPVLCHL